MPRPVLSRLPLVRTLAAAAWAASALLTASCGAPPAIGPIAADGGSTFRASAVGSGGTPLTTPDFQTTLTRDGAGRVSGSWFDVRGASGSTNLDARDLAGLAGTDAGFYAYLTAHQGPVAVYVGGVGEESHAWVPPIACYPGVPSLVLDYALNGHVGPGKRYFDPVGGTWQASILPVDGVTGLRNYGLSVHYGAWLLDRLIAKLEAAGVPEVRVFGHSKGADTCATAVYNPGLGLDRRQDPKLDPIWTFAMPVFAAGSPSKLGIPTQAAHWGGFFREYGGKLLVYNRDSDFVTYGGWFDLSSHDYSHLVADSWLAPFAGGRGQSPAWSTTENFMARYRAFAASDATADQTPETLCYDW